MKPYLLLTPGPLTTSETVKEAMTTTSALFRNSAKTWLTSPLKNRKNTPPSFYKEAEPIAWKPFWAPPSPRKTNS